MKKTISLVLVLALGLAVEVAKADFTFGEPTNLGPTINSSHQEYVLCISSDGMSLYFESDRPGGYGGSDIWISTKQTTERNPEGYWSEPQNLGPKVNSSSDDWGSSLSFDGLELYFCSNRPGGHGSYDLYLTKRDSVSEPWDLSMNLGLPVNSQYSEVSPNISSDGLSLFFSGTDSAGVPHRPGGYGQADIWVTTRVRMSDPWNPPANLGPEINTTQHDLDPSISSDSLVLFFGRGSYSVADIWLTKRNTYDAPWTDAVKLSPTVNSSRWEGTPYISTDGMTLYFSRSGGFGSVDIYQVPVIPIVDLNGDGIVDSADMCIIVDHWGTDEPLCDVGPMPWGDGIVDVQDLIVLAEHLFEEIPPVE